ncbi:MAG: CRISPR-associated helicase Cas3' [Cyanobacteriota bacterium]|nr:CRISPR-associated helicase Cas3' [Cyanobacteriota bacterium]
MMDSLLLWAKLDKQKKGLFHPPLFHLLDTATVAKQLLLEGLPLALMNRLTKGLEITQESLLRFVPFLCGVHDLGKIAPDFEFQNDQGVEIAVRLMGKEVYQKWLDRKEGEKIPHGTITAVTLPQYLKELGVEPFLAEEIAAITGGHHGIIPHPEDIREASHRKFNIGKKQWQDFRKETIDALVKYTQISTIDFPKVIAAASKIILAGLVTLSDWIASNPDWFPYSNDPLEDYVKTLDKKVETALRESGWIGWEQHIEPIRLRDLFKYIENFLPRNLQEKVEELLPEFTEQPALFIIEAPTGEGKTETAITVAEWCGTQSGIAKGAYFALPTQATSNQLYGRIQEFLEHRYPNQTTPLNLVHSHAQLSEDFSKTIVCRLDQVHEEDGTAPGVVASEWFTYRKRPLLSPWGTGTIDQALMGILRSKHNFVRLLGLAGKTVILDEIHAYDAYTSTLIESLLEWLAALGSPVVAMSATLSQKQRQAFLNAYSRGLGQSAPELEVCPYPRLTIYNQCLSQPTTSSFEVSDLNANRKIRLQWIDEEQIPEILDTELVNGGTAAVLRTLVGWAQQTYEELIPPSFRQHERLLFHSRFLHFDRRKIEEDCLSTYGKKVDHTKPRPRSVCVATQVIEQSLDLDFDFMISDLAPIDLLIQRVGRIWRHKRVRPPRLTEPTLYLISPNLDKGTPDFDSTVEQFIYERHLLLRTWDALESLKDGQGDCYLELMKWVDAHHRQIDWLIEQVYNTSRSPLKMLDSQEESAWECSHQQWKTQVEAEQDLAKKRDLPHVNCLVEAYELTHRPENMETATRLTPLNVTVVLAEETTEGLILPRTGRRIYPHRKPSKAEVKDILDHSVNLTKQGLVQQLLRFPPEEGWTENSLLRNLKLLRLHNRSYRGIAGWQVQLDDALGVITSRL